jgi:DNA-binding SARP family transcriptional activator
MLRLSLLGVPEIDHPRGAVELSRRQPLALLSVLALSQTAVSRERLAYLLWDSSPQKVASQRLRRVLSYLRQDLDAAHVANSLTTSSDTVALERNRCWVDALEFERLARQTRGAQGDAAIKAGEQALALYRGPLLDSFFLAESPEFEQWLLVERERLDDLYRRTLDRLSHVYIAAGEMERAIAMTKRSLAADPLCEETHYSLMRLFMATGRRTEALAQYQSCEQMLACEFGVEPLPETRVI